MPRKPRIDLPGLIHHVMIRGIERRPTFLKPSDYADFLNRMALLFPKTGILCYAWALMPNHIHLLLQTTKTCLSRVMQRLLTGYATAFNLRYQRAGHLFQNRYKSIVCEQETYFLQLVRYIHLNPVCAGIVQSPEELARFPWTGHGALLGIHDRPWQATDPVLARFGTSLPQARQRYEIFIREGWDQGHQEHLEGGGLIRSLGGLDPAEDAIERNDPQAYDDRILGDGDFVETVLRQAEQEDLQRQDCRSSTLSKILQTVAGVVRTDPARLTEKGRERAVSKGKALVIYCGVEWLGRTMKEMAEMTRMSQGCASRAFSRGSTLSRQFNLQERLKGN